MKALVRLMVTTLIACAAVVPVASAASQPLATDATITTRSDFTTCLVTHAPQTLSHDLVSAYAKAASLSTHNLKTVGAVRYGSCGATHWAWARVTVTAHAKLSARERTELQNRSVLFSQLAGHRWVNLGIGPVCGAAGLPVVMAHAWHVACPV